MQLFTMATNTIVSLAFEQLCSTCGGRELGGRDANVVDLPCVKQKLSRIGYLCNRQTLGVLDPN